MHALNFQPARVLIITRWQTLQPVAARRYLTLKLSNGQSSFSCKVLNCPCPVAAIIQGDNVEENNGNDFVCVLVLPETQLETTIRGNLTF